MEKDRHEDFAFVLGGTLTLLGLIVGFTFSMAVSRYDQRKNLEEDEANAIGTEYVRADLLPATDATRVREVLKLYLDQRILWYKLRNDTRLRQINVETARLQTELWSIVVPPATEKPTTVSALILAGMNDVLNSQGYTQASWWNRIPWGAWILLVLISIFCNILVGYVAHGRSGFLFLILPIALSISLFLIADIDSARNGVIRTHPQNLESLAASLQLR
jgi:ABC-type branched-subunit amino acid transport system permease subunit